MTIKSNNQLSFEQSNFNKVDIQPKQAVSKKLNIKFGRLDETLSSSNESLRRNEGNKYNTFHNGIKNQFIQVFHKTASGFALFHKPDESSLDALYLVTDPDVAAELSFCDAKVRRGAFFVYQNQSNQFGVDFISNSNDPWTESKRSAVIKAHSGWTKMTNIDNGVDGFDSRIGRGITTTPVWPDDFEQLFQDIMDGQIIEDMDHPIVKQYRKAIHGDESVDTSEADHFDDIDALLGDCEDEA